MAGVPGVLTSAEISASAQFLVKNQLPSGQIPWYAGGHGDPWNHVEATMALTATGHLDHARRAFAWLAATQRADGSWFNYYRGSAVERSRIDTNVCAYVATGLWHYLRATGDADFVKTQWPVVRRAIDFVLRFQRPDGSVAWSLDALGVAEGEALLTGSSSLFHSVRCAVALADHFDEPRPDWELSAGRIGHAVSTHPEAFAPKSQYAMDWYYPVLSGAVRGPSARARLDEGWERFVLRDKGVRCVSTNEWVTAAETAECVLTLAAVGETSRARELFATTSLHRREDGAYLTGWVYPQRATFPTDECSTYTVAAVLLAADALSEASGASDLFRHGSLPETLDFAAASCPRC